jgi:penicillin-binding protein 1A
MNLLRYLARHSIIGILSLLITALIAAGALYFYMALQLPDVDALKDVRLQEPLRIYSSDGQMIGEYGEMRRSPVTLDEVPKQLINAIVATEDQRFYEHPGVDPIGIVRAARELIITGQKTQGASTITMQVARNYFLTSKKTFTRKINEILLALKINSTFSKEKILELYVNRIYLGQRAYGVAAAAQIYYGKTLDQLNLPEIAMIAGLPQAPSRDNPITNPKSALERRNHVLQRMYEDGYIDHANYIEATAAPNTASYHGPKITLNAPYIAEMVRNVVYTQFGQSAYTSGLQVYTTIDSRLQTEANRALRAGLLAYDQRHGYRGPVQHLEWEKNNHTSAWKTQLQNIPVIGGLSPAVVTEFNQSINAMLPNGQAISIPPSGFAWSGRPNLKPGDVIRVQHDSGSAWQLSQVPKVEGAIVSLNPDNGAVMALTGGFDYSTSNFNRVIQAYRQPGSNFKPFIYAGALSKGFTFATIINDAPVVLSGIGANNDWRPENNERQFHGPTRLRIGLIKSRNSVSVRLLQMMGMRYTLNYLKNFGFDSKELPHTLSLALGTADVTPMQMVTGFAVFANGGYHIGPYFIGSVKDSDGKLLYQAHPATVCAQCLKDVAQQQAQLQAQQLPQPQIPTITPSSTPSQTPLQTMDGNPVAQQVIGTDIAYLMTNALQDVIAEGTATAARKLNRKDLAGKTGTSQNKADAWFSGFNKNIVTTVWVGFDQPQTLSEFGAQAALPIWMDFMGTVLKDQPEATLQQPDNIVTVRIDPNTGLLADTTQQNTIFEIFRKDAMPTESSPANQADSYDINDNAEAQLF